MTAVATNASEQATGFENARFVLEEIPLSKIRIGKHALRDADRNDEEFQRLRDSIASTNGPFSPILVREIDDPENKGQIAYGLVDGRQRYTACVDLGFTVIPARVVDMDEAKVAFAQIIANRSRIETKPTEYTNQLRRMFNSDPTLTLEELSEELHCSTKWLQDRLSLTNLHPDLGNLVDEGRIPIGHAFALAKLQPKDEQLQFAETAQTQTIQEFSGHIQNRAKALRDAARAGREAKGNEWAPVAHMLPAKDIKAQYEAPTLAGVICQEVGADTAEAGFHAALKWVFNMNPSRVEFLRQKAIDDKAKSDATKAKLNAEKMEKKAVAARAAAHGISVEELLAKEKADGTTPAPATVSDVEGDPEDDE